jgi:hypothetical protein
MATHQEIRLRKNIALTFVFEHVRVKKGTIKLNDVYNYVADVWNSPGQFIQDVLKAVPEDIVIETTKRKGTFARVAIPAGVGPIAREAIMGGLWPQKYEGVKVDAPAIDEMVLLKKHPKMFQPFEDTVEVYRLDKDDEPSKYLQITTNGESYLFSQV